VVQRCAPNYLRVVEWGLGSIRWDMRARCLTPMGFHWSTPIRSWTRLGCPGHYCSGLGCRGAHPYPSLTILSWGGCRTLGELAFEPLDRRGFRTCGSFSAKAISERVGCLLCVEDGHTFLGGFLREVEQVLQRLWPDGTFCPWAGALNACLRVEEGCTGPRAILVFCYTGMVGLAPEPYAYGNMRGLRELVPSIIPLVG
jgi:hypothetical protein